ncbi:MAG: DUF3006 domain-containing protein [Ruminococcus sp.]|nr:DUF3006 domain-containing protein [Ruminococcus sp.]MDE6502684.1 DUF3006 domain-containing protein [Ruminococcus sp.]
MTVIDRFENNIAVLESDGVIIETDRSLLPENAREGDVVVETDGQWTVDVSATEERRTQIRELMKRLMKK